MRKTLIYKGVMVLLDIFIVNFSYFFALIARFFIGSEFRAGAEKYMAVFWQIAPVYTIVCLIVFALFKLYNTLWRLAGIRDLNNIILASLSTSVLYVAGSMLTGNRMPLSIYFIGPCFQLILLVLSRFAIKFILSERANINSQKNATINVMMIGIQQMGQIAKHTIEQNETMKIVCVVDTKDTEAGRYMNGLPVIGGTDNIAEAMKKYGIRYVVIADTFLDDAKRMEIRNLCKEKEIDIVDMTGFIQNGNEPLSLPNILQVIEGPITLHTGDKTKTFDTAEQAMMTVTNKYYVNRITADNITIDIRQNPMVQNDVNEDWVKEYKQETGNDVSFF